MTRTIRCDTKVLKSQAQRAISEFIGAKVVGNGGVPPVPVENYGVFSMMRPRYIKKITSLIITAAQLLEKKKFRRLFIIYHSDWQFLLTILT